MKKTIWKMIAVLCVVCMACPLPVLVHAENKAPVVIENCAVYTTVSERFLWISLTLSPQWSPAEDWQARFDRGEVKLSRKSFTAEQERLCAAYDEVAHTFNVRYSKEYTSDALAAGTQLVFPQGFFTDGGRQNEPFAVEIDQDTMAGSGVYFSRSDYKYKPEMYNTVIMLQDEVMVPFGFEQELHFTVEPHDGQPEYQLVDEMGNLFICERNKTLYVTVTADGEAADSASFFIEKSWTNAWTFLTGSCKAFGEGLIEGVTGVFESAYSMFMFLFGPLVALLSLIIPI